MSLGELLCLVVKAFGKVSREPGENHQIHCKAQGPFPLQGDWLDNLSLRQVQDGSRATNPGAVWRKGKAVQLAHGQQAVHRLNGQEVHAVTLGSQSRTAQDWVLNSH